MGPASVVVAPVERGSVELTQPLVATVEPVTSTTVAAEQEGLVAERLFDEGQLVEKGQTLVRNKTDLLEIERDAARANLQSAAALVQQAEADADKARREFQRIEELFKQQKIVSEKEYRDAMAADLSAQAQVAARQAQQLAYKAALERLNLLIEKSQIRAPFDGVVSRRQVEVGQWISQGDPVGALVQMDPLFVRVNVPEYVIARVKSGDQARVTIDALGGQTLSGVVEQILPEADPASRTVPVKIRLPNPELRIRPGFFARAVLVSGSDASLLVPRDAVVTQGGRSHVVAVREGAAVIVPVELGPTSGDRISVRGELNEGESVVIRGNESLMPGTPLQVLSSAAPATRPAGGQ